jgi:hypothetical protein
MPFWKSTFQTSLSPDQVADRLRALLRPRVGFWEGIEQSLDPQPDRPPFRGEVSDRAFKMTRVIGYRNSFLPVLRGRIEDDATGGSVVRIRMTLPAFTAIFLIFWIGFIARFLIGDLAAVGHLRSYAPLFMLLFAVVLTPVAFFAEVRKAEQLLRKAL